MINKKYSLLRVFGLIMIPIVGVFGTGTYVYFNGIVWQEPFILISGWWIAGMGITFGYHRLFAHRSFNAHPVIQFLAMLCGSAALQNTILKWSSDHRIHHKKLDTDDDPYSITKGFFYAHMGWIFEKTQTEIKGVNDLQKNSVVMFQHKYYWSIAIGLTFVLPMLLGFLYERPFGALLWGGFLRLTLVHHSTFLINSLCHYTGKQPFESNSTARDSWWVAFLTFGEGFHNFHHKFQWDYRNGIRWYDFDPGKWAIKFLSFFKLTSNIRKVDEYKILQARFNGLKDKIDTCYSNLPDRIQITYESRIKDAQNQSQKIYDAWQNFEKEFKLLKENGFKNKFQKSSMKYHRKMLRSEYISLLKSFSILFNNLKIQQGIK